MEKTDQKYLIDAYLSNELEGEMMEQFQIQISLDKDFEKEVKFQKEIHDSLTDTHKANVRETLNNYHKEQAVSHTSILHRIRTEAIAAAIISIMIIGATIGGFFNFSDTNQSVYDSYFSGDINKIVVRSVEQKQASNIDKGIDLFNNEEYKLALEYFELDTDINKAVLYSGICNMKLGEFDNAIVSFSKLLNENNSLVVDQAEWFMALSYLSIDNTDKAVELFTTISETDGVYQASALDILYELKE